MVLKSPPNPVVRAVAEAGLLPAKDVAARLIDLLGADLTAAIGQVGEARAARAWAEGTRACFKEDALKAALLAAVAVAEMYGPDSARAWFTSTNPDLGWKSPLVFIRSTNNPEHYDRLVQVAAQDAQ
jgi:hypothetical protein